MEFGTFKLEVNQAIGLLQEAVATLGLQPGGDYVLTKLSSDGSENDIVALRTNLPRSRLANVTEKPETYNHVSMGVWSDVMKLLVGLDVLHGGMLEVSLVSMGDLIAKRGAPWIVQTMAAFQTALDGKASLLCDEQDEGDVSRRIIMGEELSDIVLNRVRGTDSLPKPLLALVRAELCTQDIHEVAREQGIRTGVTSKMYILFSTLDAA
jgi:hypothetical protein